MIQTSDEAPLQGGGGKNNAPLALLQQPALNLFQGRLLFPALALGGLLLLGGCVPAPSKVHNDRGVALVKQGKYLEAEKEYREAIRLKPDLAETHLLLAVLLHHQGKNEEAEKDFREAVRLRPEDAATLWKFASFLDDLGRRKEARQYWERALKVDTPEPWVIRSRLADPD